MSPPHKSVISTLFRSMKFLYTKTGISEKKKRFAFKFPKNNIASEVITVALLGEVDFHYVLAMQSLTASFKFPQKRYFTFSFALQFGGLTSSEMGQRRGGVWRIYLEYKDTKIYLEKRRITSFII